MKAIVCPQCGGLISNVIEGRTIAECGYCGAKVLLQEAALPPKEEPPVRDTLHVPLEDYKPFDEYDPYSVSEPEAENYVPGTNKAGTMVVGIIVAVVFGAIVISVIILAANKKPKQALASTPASLPVVTPEPGRISAIEVTNADAIVLPKAVLPANVRIAQRTQIVVYVSVDEGGNVYQAEAYDGPEALKKAAAKAAEKAKFKSRDDGRMASGTLTYDFGPK